MTSELKVDKITPASGTNTQIGESGDTTNLSAGTVTLPTSIITGQSAKTSLADADKFLISDSAASGAFKYVENQYLGGGQWDLIQSIDASSTATVEFTYDFPTTYNNYYIYFNDLGVANNGHVAFRAATGGGSIGTGGNDYQNARYGTRADGDNGSADLRTGDGNVSMININNPSALFSGTFNMHGYVWIMNPNDDHYKFFQFNAVFGASGNNTANIQGGGAYFQTGNLSKIQFLNENGDNMSGKFRLYGLKNA